VRCSPLIGRTVASPRTRDVVVIGGSAGGLLALLKVVAAFPVDLPAAVLVVLHLTPDAGTALATILARSGPLSADYAVHGQPLRRGHLTIAPPDRHLLVEGDTTVLSHRPLEHWNRPAVDPLFRSAAANCGDRVVAVVLSGALDDGASGAAVVTQADGVVLVQDPHEALLPTKPLAALRAVPGACVAPSADLGRLICGLLVAPG
jgi:two-component system chemotaxis response regulator CheB